MAYTDKRGLDSGKVGSMTIVAVITALILYLLVAVNYETIKKSVEELKTFDVEEPPPPPEKLPPPPPKTNLPPPPVVSPPPIVSTNISVPTITTVATPPPVFNPTPEPPRPAPPPPPPKPVVASKAVQRGGSITDEDYPPAAIRNEEAGTSVATFTVGTDGKVQSCSASGASASLDAETCKLILRRFRYKPALDANGQPVAETKTQRISWRLPK